MAFAGAATATATSLTDDIRYLPVHQLMLDRFDRDGILHVPRALDGTELARATAATDQIYADEQCAGRLRPDGQLHLRGVLRRSPALLELIDHPTTFRFVWGLLGWNVYSHESYLNVCPGSRDAPSAPRSWYQDGYRQNADIDAEVRPMLSITIGYVLSDLSLTGRGAARVLPGSQVHNALPGRAAGRVDRDADPAGAIEIVAKPGDAVVVDRRLWRCRSVNQSAMIGKLVAIGYTHRWIRPLDEIDYPADTDWFATQSALRRQLLGGGRDHANYWGVGQDGRLDTAIPLRAELAARGLLDGSRPYLC